MNDLVIKWKDKEYKLAARGPKGRMLAGAKIEETITLPELATGMQTGKIPTTKLCIAYSSLLQHVGATATQEDVLEDLFDAEDQDTMQEKFGGMLTTIMTVLSPADTSKKVVIEAPLAKSTRARKKE